MRIDRKLNLVIPLERDEGDTLYVHSTPISREQFERYFLVISKTLTALYAEGLSWHTGPRVAFMMLKRIAVETGAWDGPAGVELGLIAEIRRLTNVIVMAPSGWTSMPLDVAAQQDLLSEDEVSEVENAVTFFTVVCAMHKKAEAEQIMTAATRLWDGSTTSSSSTEYMSSLRTSTAAEPSGKKETPSSIPS